MKNGSKRYSLLGIALMTAVILLNGCSLSKTGQPEITVTPALPISPVTPTSVPIVIPTPTTLPVSVRPIPTAVTSKPSSSPTPTFSPAASMNPVSGNLNSPDVQETAAAILNQMTPEEKVGQLFFVRCRKDTALEDIRSYHPGGYILFAEDFKDRTKEKVKSTIDDYQTASAVSMLIGVDEEGGTVNRISKYPQYRQVPFKSPQELYKLGGFDLITGDTLEKARLLKSLGINVNLVPVCDVSTDPKDFIYPRAFGKNVVKTSEYVQTIVTAMNSENLGCTLKHFPGYGNNADTHTGIAIDNRSYNNFVKSDFLPFEAGINAGAGSILVSHNIVTSMDKDLPSSLSRKVHEILRNDIGFQGVIMTDDLSMEAITQYTDNQNAAVLAVLAGNDLLIASDFDVQIPAVIAAVKDGTIPEAVIDTAVTRVLLWKLTLEIIEK